MVVKGSANFDILNTHTDGTGRILLVIVTINNSAVTLVHIYGPNSDDGSFFRSYMNCYVIMVKSYIYIRGRF